MKILFETLPELKKYCAPSFTTIKRWSQKVGYYKLTQIKEVANDWMVLIDASIQMGEKKCVVILGCREANRPHGTGNQNNFLSFIKGIYNLYCQ